MNGKQPKQQSPHRLMQGDQESITQSLDTSLSSDHSRTSEREFRTGSYVLGGVALGLFVFSLFLGPVSSDGRREVMGVSFLMACIAGGFRLASYQANARNPQSV